MGHVIQHRTGTLYKRGTRRSTLLSISSARFRKVASREPRRVTRSGPSEHTGASLPTIGSPSMSSSSSVIVRCRSGPGTCGAKGATFSTPASACAVLATSDTEALDFGNPALAALSICNRFCNASFFEALTAVLREDSESSEGSGLAVLPPTPTSSFCCSVCLCVGVSVHRRFRASRPASRAPTAVRRGSPGVPARSVSKALFPGALGFAACWRGSAGRSSHAFALVSSRERFALVTLVSGLSRFCDTLDSSTSLLRRCGAGLASLVWSSVPPGAGRSARVGGRRASTARAFPDGGCLEHVPVPSCGRFVPSSARLLSETRGAFPVLQRLVGSAQVGEPRRGARPVGDACRPRFNPPTSRSRVSLRFEELLRPKLSPAHRGTGGWRLDRVLRDRSLRRGAVPRDETPLGSDTRRKGARFDPLCPLRPASRPSSADLS